MSEQLSDPERRLRRARAGTYHGRLQGFTSGAYGSKAGRAAAEERASFGENAARLANSRGIFDDE